MKGTASSGYFPRKVSRRPCHLLNVACSSVSSTATRSPEAAATVARVSVVVVLDVPPLPDATPSHLVPDTAACEVSADLITGRPWYCETPGFVGPGPRGVTL